MEKLIESFSMVRIPIFVHGNLDNQKYHGRIAGNAPWKNSKSRFPWSEFPKLTMEFLKMRISMVVLGKYSAEMAAKHSVVRLKQEDLREIQCRNGRGTLCCTVKQEDR